MIKHIVSYQWLRTRRWWLCPVVIAVCALMGIFSIMSAQSQQAMTGMDFIYESSTFLTVAMFIISAAAALAINREADEDSADILWALPIDNASMIFGKFLGLMPMVLFAAAAYWLPHAVMITANWAGSGLSIWYLAGELGFAALMQGAGMISAAAAGGFLGLILRGFWLYGAVIALWVGTFASTITSIWPLYESAPEEHIYGIMFRQLIDWILNGPMVIPNQMPRDLYTAALYPGMLWQRVFYIALALFIAALAAVLIRRHRAAGRARMVSRTALSVSLVLVICAAAVFFYEQGYGYRKYRDEMAFYDEYYGHFYSDKQPSANAVELPSADYLAKMPLYIDSYDLDVDVTKPPALSVKAGLNLRNVGGDTIENPLITLWHGFDVTYTSADGKKLTARRVGDGVYLEGLSLNAGASAHIDMEYTGSAEWWGIYYLQPRLNALADKYGFMLPADYGWYPLTTPLPLMKATDLASFEKNGWGVSLTGVSQIVPSSLINEMSEKSSETSGNVDPWRRQSYFTVTVHKDNASPVVSSIGEAQNPCEEDVRIAGKGHYLTLACWPLERVDVDGSALYRPLEYKGDEGKYPVTVMNDTWKWFGISGRKAVGVIMPPYNGDRSMPELIDSDQGFYMAANEAMGYEPDFFYGVMTDRAESGGAGEYILSVIYPEWREWKYNGSYDLQEMEGYIKDVDGFSMSDADKIMKWFTSHDDAAAQAVLHELYMKAQKQPLSAEDIKEAFGS